MSTASRRCTSLRPVSRGRAARWDPLLLALVGVPGVGAVTTLVVSSYLSGGDLLSQDAGSVVFTIVFTAWSLLPFAAAAVVGGCVHRYWRAGSAVALVGAVLLVAFTVWLLRVVLIDESSTAVLALLFAPFVQGAVAGVAMAASVAVSVAVARLRRRRAVRAGERLRR